MLGKELGMHERQFDRVTDGIDLVAESADVLVADVGHLLEDELLDLGLRDALEHVPGADIAQQRVAGPHPVLAQGLSNAHDSLLVGVT